MKRILSRTGGLPVVVAVLTLVTAVQMSLVAVGNITDYGTNYAFVRHVLAMDTTFRSPNLMWRAITDSGVATGVYVAVIGWESITAVVLLGACVAWASSLFGGKFAVCARPLSSLGWLMWLMLFGGGFLAIGGEWFEMWQSAKWSGIQSALEYFIIAAVGMILVQLAAARPGAGDTE